MVIGFGTVGRDALLVIRSRCTGGALQEEARPGE
jgi:hypothetical protein